MSVAVGCELGERNRGGEEREEVGRRFAEIVVLGERVAERRGGAVGRGNGLFAIAAEGYQDFGYNRGAVVGKDTEGVAGFVGEAGIREVELDVVNLLGGAGGVEIARGEQESGERIFSRITRGSLRAGVCGLELGGGCR